MERRKTELISSTPLCEVWFAELADGTRAVIKRYKYSDSLYSLFARVKAINCDGIPAIYSIDRADYFLEVTEEFISGRNLADVMANGRKFTSNETRSIGLCLCDTLEKLHGGGIIHRDIKPSNIMLTDNGTIKLIDFNAARAYDGKREKDTHLLGTDGYAAPEQYGFSETDFRADIYSVGVTLKELCQGKLGSLKRAVSGCTEFDPNKRYKTVKALRRDIRRPYRRELTGGIISAVTIVGLILLFTLVDVPSLLSELTGKAVYEADMISPVKVEYRLNDGYDNYFSDGEGEIEFRYGQPIDNDYGILYDHPDAQYVDFTMPSTSLLFRISKTGSAVVDNVRIIFEMHGIFLRDPGWTSDSVEFTNHVNGVGAYAGAVWRCDTALSGEEFTLDFKNAAVFGDSPHISVTVCADGFKDKTFDIAVKKSENYLYPFSRPEDFEYIFDCEPLIGERLSLLTTGMGEDYSESEFGDCRLIIYDDISISFVVNDNDIIIGLLGTKGVRLSGTAQVGMTFDELEQGLASLTWTDETVSLKGRELTVAIANIGGLDYRVYFDGQYSVLAEF